MTTLEEFVVSYTEKGSYRLFYWNERVVATFLTNIPKNNAIFGRRHFDSRLDITKI